MRTPLLLVALIRVCSRMLPAEVEVKQANVWPRAGARRRRGRGDETTHTLPIAAQGNGLLRRTTLAAALAVALLLPAAARADHLFVDCGADPATLPPNTYPTITAALSNLSLEGPHTITVSGTCVENVQLQSRERLTLEGPVNGMATIVNAADPPFWTIAIGRSRQISLGRLIVRGGSVGIRIDSGSSVDISDCVVEDNPGQAVVADENSTIRINRVTIRNNGAGLNVSNSSHVSLSLGAPQPPFVHIHNNEGPGINISHATVRIFAACTIENNGGGAIGITAGRLQMNGGPAEAGNILRNNEFGMNVGENSSVIIGGNNLIQNNAEVGIQIFRSSSLNIGGGQAPDGTPLFTVIEGHSDLGLNIVQNATVGIAGAHKIRNNGFGSTQPEIAGGIRVGRSGLVLTGPVEVVNNNGPGIQTDLGATLVISSTVPGPPPAQITGNSAEGILMTGLSATRLFQVPTISGNGGASISCDGSSWLFGDTTGITGMKCSNTDKGKK